MCEVNAMAQSSNNRGLRWAISSSNASTGSILGWLTSELNALTTPSFQQATTANVEFGTTVHTQANVMGPDTFRFWVMNAPSTSTYSIAVRVLNSVDTATVFAGSMLRSTRM